LGAARRSNLCCHPSLVAIASSNEAFNLSVLIITGSKAKTTELLKSYKRK
jgi:UDP-N-acetylmuramyl pentapeptide synthase